MKSLLISFCFLLLALPISAQRRAFQQNRELHRIQLAEKSNHPLQSFVLQLMEAYKAGRITGFYPNAPEARLSYNEFLVRFKLARRVGSGQDDFLYCDGGADYRYNSVQNPDTYTEMTVDDFLEKELYPHLQQVLDLVQDRVVDRTTGEQIYDIKLVRIVWVNDQPGNGLPEMNAVCFKWQDVLNLNLVLPNRNNDASPFSAELFFGQKMYTSNIVMTGTQYVRSLKEADNTRKRRGQFEANIWSY